MKKVLIAGGGVAGLAAAVYLDTLDYEITLLERRPILGGRAYSFTDKITGLKVDNGQHVMVGAYHTTLEFLQMIGVASQLEWLIPTDIPLVTQGHLTAHFTLNTWPPPLNVLRAIFNFSGFSVKDKLNFIKIFFSLKKKHKQDETVHVWLNRLGQSEEAQRNFWDILTYATLNDAPSLTTAEGLMTVLKGCYLNGKRDGLLILPKVGLSELFANPAEAYLIQRGHTVMKNSSLSQVRILNNRVQSFVSADNHEHKADLYVCGLPFHQVKNVLPPAFLQNHVKLKHIDRMTPSPIVSINLFYDRPFMPVPFVGSSLTKVHWFFRKTHSSPQHIVGVISGGYEYLTWSKENIVTVACRDLALLYPAVKTCRLVHSLVNIERHATLSCRPGINALRPKQHVLDNFFLIGDWTDTGLPPTIESAVVSAKRVYVEILDTSKT